MLPVVYAYRDEGEMSLLTRWKPRRVVCTQDAGHADLPGLLYVVKFAQGKPGAAALISEVICTEVFKRAGLATLEPVLVSVSPAFAASCNLKSDFPYKIQPGYHFGTIHKNDVEAGPPLGYDDLYDPTQLIDIWVFDTWVGNIDRECEGNTLLRVTKDGTFDLIASDQSDCFCGAKVFCSNEFESSFRKRGRSPSVGFLPYVIAANDGPKAIWKSLKKVDGVLPNLPEVMKLVPEEWWSQAQIEPMQVLRQLRERARRLNEILNPDEWGVSHGLFV